LLIEKTILIQHIKDIKGTKKPKYEFPSRMFGETILYEKSMNFVKYAITPRKMLINMLLYNNIAQYQS